MSNANTVSREHKRQREHRHETHFKETSTPTSIRPKKHKPVNAELRLLVWVGIILLALIASAYFLIS